jgi:hypothetical protein
MQTLYIPSFSNNKPLRYYDNKNRILVTSSNATIAKRILEKRNFLLDRTITRIILGDSMKSQYHDYDSYRCKVWIYPNDDLTQIQAVNMKDVLVYGDMFVVIDKEEGHEYSANLYVPNGPIIDVDYVVEIPNDQV